MIPQISDHGSPLEYKQKLDVKLLILDTPRKTKQLYLAGQSFVSQKLI